MLAFFLAVGACLVLVLLLGAISRSVTYQSRVDVTRTYTGQGIAPNSNVLVNGDDTLTTLNGSTTPAISLDASITLALAAGAVTLDLTAIADPTLGTVNANGLTPFVMKLQNPSTNANPITVKQGAANGYTGFGTNFLVTLQPGEEMTILKQVAAGIGGTVKTLDLTGTGTQALTMQFAFG